MKLPPYHLQTLLEMREREKEAAEHAFADAQKVLAAEKKRKEDMEKELEKMVLRREQRRREYAEKQMRGEMSTQAVVAANVYIDRLKKEEEAQKEAIAAQANVVTEKERLVEQARDVMVAATQKLKALQKHKEKWEIQMKKEIMGKEENEMDDLSQAAYSAKTRNEG
jgi:flagellar export protein FliJ